MINSKKKKYNPEPWLTPLFERKSYIKGAASQGYSIAVHFYDAADASTFRYRCYNVKQSLQSGKAWRSTYFFFDELDQIEDILPFIQLPIIVRMKWRLETEVFIEKLREISLPIIFDVDDRVFDLDLLPVIMNGLDQLKEQEEGYDTWVALIGRYQKIACLADAFTTTNDFLGRALEEKFNKPYVVIRNFLNEEQLQVSAEAIKYKGYYKKRRPFTLGYFSGTPTHINDFKCIYKEVMLFLEEHIDARLLIVGFMDIPEEMKHLEVRKQIIRKPLVDFIELQTLISQVDVNLVPLVQNVFTNAKSELKFFEAAIVETLTIATPTFTYAESIRHGENGFLCSPGEWYYALEEIYQKKINEEAMVTLAKEEVFSRYTPQVQQEIIEEKYTFLAKKFYR
ncbi:MAG: glycosyltransferase family 4 protein [Clostridiales bacterium]|nr:glycosyltransferase family 4 protein [Clostridiales bacterium]